jgi:type II secretory pathway component GspD/PulD (secretin)
MSANFLPHPERSALRYILGILLVAVVVGKGSWYLVPNNWRAEPVATRPASERRTRPLDPTTEWDRTGRSRPSDDSDWVAALRPPEANKGDRPRGILQTTPPSPVAKARFSGQIQPVAPLPYADGLPQRPPAPPQFPLRTVHVQATESVGGPITFNFMDAPWPVVLKKVADEAGLALEMNAVPKGLFSYFDPHPHSLVESMDILNGFLIREGFLLIRHQKLLLMISTEEDVPVHLIELVRPEQLSLRGRYELLSVELPVFDASPSILAAEVEKLLTPLGKIIPVNSANRLVVSDLRSRLELILGLITMGDAETGKLRSEVVKLQNILAEEAVQSLQNVLSRTGQSASRTTSPPRSAGSQAQAGGNIRIVALPETNSVIIQGQPAQLQRTRSLIADLDRSPAQVHIQVLLVEVELSDKDEFGIELGIQDSLLFDRSVVQDILTTTETTTAPNGVQTTTENIISSQTSPGFNFNNHAVGNNTSANPARLASQALSTLAVGRVNTDVGYGGLVLSAGSQSLNILLRALEANRKVDVLSRPNIRTIDNREASIQMGAQVPVVDGVNVTANGSVSPVVRQDKAGIILEVTPKISESGLIFMEIRAEKSEFRTGPGSGTPIFVDATNGNVIESPIKDLVELVATVNVMSGQTVVLGGMITRSSIDVSRAVPVLGDLPIVGPLFRYDLYSEQRKELLIFLTPEIIHDDRTAQEITYRELNQSAVNVEEMLETRGGSSDMRLPNKVVPSLSLRSAPGFHPFQNWSVPTWKRLGDPSPSSEMLGPDRSEQVGQFLASDELQPTRPQETPSNPESLPTPEEVMPPIRPPVFTPQPSSNRQPPIAGNRSVRGR